VKKHKSICYCSNILFLQQSFQHCTIPVLVKAFQANCAGGHTYIFVNLNICNWDSFHFSVSIISWNWRWNCFICAHCIQQYQI